MRERVRNSVISIAIFTALAGCKPATEVPPAAEPTPVAMEATTPDPTKETAPLSTAASPAPSTADVLERISNVDGQGADSYAIANGSTIHFWRGITFEADGKRYYTGFAWSTPEKYGAARDNNTVDPNAKVTLSHSTYVANAPGAETPWTWEGSEVWSGEFGQAEQANAIDTTREAQTFTTPSGRFVLAQPTLVSGASGATTPAFDILVFNPHELQGTHAKERKWLHVGTLPAGGAVSPATLEFVAAPGADLPTLRISGVDHPYDQANHAYTTGTR